MSTRIAARGASNPLPHPSQAMERKFAELRKMKCVVCNEAGGVKVQCVHKRAPRPGPDQRAMARLDIAPDRKRRKKATSVGMHKSNRRDH